jgi:hypothetical protein
VLVAESTRPDGQDVTVDVGFEVGDTGIGFAADRLRRMFEPFTRPTGTTREFVSSGAHRNLPVRVRTDELRGGSACWSSTTTPRTDGSSRRT